MEEYYQHFLIGSVSKIFNISPSIIRHYEKIGLINSIKDDNNYRKYDLTLIEQMYTILMLRSFELPLSDILKIKDSITNDTDQVLKTLENQIALTEMKLEQLKLMSQKTSIFLNEFKRLEGYKDKFVIKDSPKLLFTNIYETLDSKIILSKIYKVLNESLLLPKTAFFIDKNNLLSKKYSTDFYTKFGICVDVENKSEYLNIGDYEVILPSQKCLYTVFIGSIHDIDKKYDEILMWIDNNNYKLVADPYELGSICLDDKNLIELYFPVESIK